MKNKITKILLVLFLLANFFPGSSFFSPSYAKAIDIPPDNTYTIPAPQVQAYLAGEDQDTAAVQVFWNLPEDAEPDAYGFIVCKAGPVAAPADTQGHCAAGQAEAANYYPSSSGFSDLTDSGYYYDEAVAEGDTYTYYVKAYDRSGVESDFGQATIKIEFPFEIENIASSSVCADPKLAISISSTTPPTATKATINWHANTPMSGSVQVGENIGGDFHILSETSVGAGSTDQEVTVNLPVADLFTSNLDCAGNPQRTFVFRAIGHLPNDPTNQYPVTSNADITIQRPYYSLSGTATFDQSTSAASGNIQTATCSDFPNYYGFRGANLHTDLASNNGGVYAVSGINNLPIALDNTGQGSFSAFPLLTYYGMLNNADYPNPSLKITTLTASDGGNNLSHGIDIALPSESKVVTNTMTIPAESTDGSPVVTYTAPVFYPTTDLAPNATDYRSIITQYRKDESETPLPSYVYRNTVFGINTIFNYNNPTIDQEAPNYLDFLPPIGSFTWKCPPDNQSQGIWQRFARDIHTKNWQTIEGVSTNRGGLENESPLCPKQSYAKAIAITNITISSATISWNTPGVQAESTDVVEYGQTESYGQTATGGYGGEPGLETHQVTISNLEMNKPYHFRIKSTRNSDNMVFYSNDHFFHTLNMTIFNVQIFPGASGAGTLITWETTGKVDFSYITTPPASSSNGGVISDDGITRQFQTTVGTLPCNQDNPFTIHAKAVSGAGFTEIQHRGNFFTTICDSEGGLDLYDFYFGTNINNYSGVYYLNFWTNAPHASGTITLGLNYGSTDPLNPPKNLERAISANVPDPPNEGSDTFCANNDLYENNFPDGFLTPGSYKYPMRLTVHIHDDTDPAKSKTIDVVMPVRTSGWEIYGTFMYGWSYTEYWYPTQDEIDRINNYCLNGE